MASASESKRRLTTLFGIALAGLFAVWFSGSLATPAVAEPNPAGLTLDNAPPERAPRIVARFANHHEEEAENEEGEGEDNLDFELMELEVERTALETYFGGLELIEKIAELAADDDLAAVFVLTTVTDEYDLPESQLLEFLKEVEARASSTAARRVAVMKLAEIHMERNDTEAALAAARRLMLGD